MYRFVLCRYSGLYTLTSLMFKLMDAISCYKLFRCIRSLTHEYYSITCCSLYLCFLSQITKYFLYTNQTQNISIPQVSKLYLHLSNRLNSTTYSFVARFPREERDRNSRGCLCKYPWNIVTFIIYNIYFKNNKDEIHDAANTIVALEFCHSSIQTVYNKFLYKGLHVMQ